MSISGKALAEKADIAYQEKWGYIWATIGETWTDIKQKNLENKYYKNPSKYEDYKQGAEYGSKWIGHKVADCSGLIKWAAAQLGLKGIYHGSNSQFNKNCKKVGKIVKGQKIPIGALVFTGDESMHNHVGVLISETCVCESKSTINGVVHTPLSNKKWTYYGLLKGVNYDVVSIEHPSSFNKVQDKLVEEKKHPTLRRGARGEEVVLLQTLLAKDGSSLEIDGIFGPGTQSAVRSFQKRHELEVDGIVGPKTWAELLKI